MRITADMIDPQLRRTGLVLRRFGSRIGDARLRRGSLALGRVTAVAYRRRPRTMRVREFHIPRADGSRLRVMVYSPLTPARDATGLLWFHGGGYALGSPEQDAAFYRRMITATGCVIVAPAYRLSTALPYPAALDDAYDALIWLRDNAARLGVRDDQIAVGGESAGGGLTAALTLLARDRGEVNVAFQLPIYPMLDDRVTTPSAVNNDAPLLDSTTLRSAWRLYLGRGHLRDDVPIYAAPARATDLRGLPPTFTYVGDLEPFLDETAAYVNKLRDAGVPVDFEIYPGCWHGFDRIVPTAEVSRRALRSRERWFRHAVASYFAPQPTRSTGLV
ncbi:alpha/beta hydrolase [Nocardia sp. NPDC055321]